MSEKAPVEPLVGQAMQAMQARQWAQAENYAAQALARLPQSYEARQVRALAPLYAGRAADALPHAEALVDRFPNDPFAHNTYGAVLQVLGRSDKAIKAYRKSVTLAPQHPVSWLNLAQLHAAAGDDGEAIACYEKLIALGSAAPEVLQGLATVRARRAASELDDGDLDAALADFARLESAALPPDPWRFKRALAWPAIMDSREQIARRFGEVDRALDDLIARPAVLSDPLREVALTGFYMAYQGFDDTGLQRKIAQAYRLASPGLEWSAPHLSRPRAESRKIRLGILSRHLTNHTIGKLNIGIAQKIDRERFEVVVLRPPAAPDFLGAAFEQCADATVPLPLDLAGARAKVAEAELDALFYPDIGMDVFTYYLPYARLARVQFTTLGHPVTTGIPNMDYFVSSRHNEPPGAQRFYHERLVEIESWPAYFYRPRPPSSFDLRERLGLAGAHRIYACPQTLYKIHPDFDDTLAQILREDPHGRVVLIAQREAWNEKLRRRFRRVAPDVADRILFVPGLSLPDFLAALRSADALLDTFHFGGGLSSYEAFGMSAPVVTLPGERMRARLTAGLYAQMGVSRWIARSTAEYVKLAVELANASDERRQWREEIEAGANRFLENETVVRELEAFIEAAVRETARG